MKVTCNRKRLLTAFQLAASAAPTRTPKPVLRNVKIEVGDERVSLLATNLENSVRVVVEGAMIRDTGVALLPIDRFRALLTESRDERLNLEATPQAVLVTGNRLLYRLLCEDVADFPPVPEFSGSVDYVLPPQSLCEAFRRTEFATAKYDFRYAIHGVLMEFSEDAVIAVATDGNRMAKAVLPAIATERPDAAQCVILSRSAIRLLTNVLADETRDVGVVVTQNDLVVQSENAVVTTRLLEGTFPPSWKKLVAARTKTHRITAIAGPLYADVRQAAIVSSRDDRSIACTFRSGELCLNSPTENAGSARIVHPIDYDGEPITVKLNYPFLADFLKVLDPGKTFTIEIKDANSAVVCTTDDGYTYIIMPMMM